MVYDVGMRCLRCGPRSVVSNYDERRCLMCGWEPPPPDLDCVTHAAVRCGVSVRTLRRWMDAGLVHGERGARSGRVRLVDVVSVERYIAMPPRRWRQAGPLVTVHEAAKALGLRYKLVVRWARTGGVGEAIEGLRSRAAGDPEYAAWAEARGLL